MLLILYQLLCRRLLCRWLFLAVPLVCSPATGITTCVQQRNTTAEQTSGMSTEGQCAMVHLHSPTQSSMCTERPLTRLPFCLLLAHWLLILLILLIICVHILSLPTITPALTTPSCHHQSHHQGVT
jgi:hypothetical protein